MTEKLYISPQSLLEDSFELGSMILESGFQPSFIIALWRGAAPIGIAVQEFLAYNGIVTDHIAIRTASYTGIDSQTREVEIHGINYLIKNVTFKDRLLIVDDVFDTGQTIDSVLKRLKAKARRNMPGDIRVAVPYYKPNRNRSSRSPDYFIHETDQWIKFPHSLEGLTDDEIRKNRPSLHAILESVADE